MASTNETETFQHYQVLRRADGTLHELGRGAMGVTYKAFDTNLRSYVALKVINALHLDSETARARFLREARAAAALRHRNIASVYHLGNDDQSFFYAMEFVDGQTLEALVKEQNASLPPPVALQIALQVSRALGAASKQGLVHRDIKPANIMVEREDDDEDGFVVKVIDFGLARSAAGGEGSAHITMGGFVGTPQYASPEQLEEKDLDIRSDIYSLGITLWYMLAGKPPFVGPLGSVFIQQLTKEPPWDHLTGQPEQVRALLGRLLQKDPDKRPQSPTELRREIEVCLRSIPSTSLRGAGSPGLLPPAKTITDTTTGSQTLPTKTKIAVPPTVSPPSTVSHPPVPPVPVPASASMPIDGETLVRPAVVTTGTLLSGRYDLGDLVGQGNNGRVFHARDLARDSRGVAVKVLHANVLTLAAERTRLAETLETLHRTPHPSLMEVESFEQTPGCRYLVEEWVSGFTLVDLLRSRGQLPVRETLLLLAQTSAAADHAFGSGLNRLELGLHQILVHFPSLAAGPQTLNRTLLSTTVDKWPTDFTLKLDALGITREAGDSVTWSGDMTMLPSTPMLGRDTQTSIRGLVESSQFFALGMLTYELLNGAPPVQGRGEDGRGIKFAALPSLNEEANDVLRRMLTPNPGFTSGTEFFQALCEASGVTPRAASSATAVPPAPAPVPEMSGGETMLFDSPATMRAMPEAEVSETMIPRDVPLVEEAAESRFDTVTTTRTPEPTALPAVEEVSAESVAPIPDEAAPAQPMEARHDTSAAEIFEPPTPAVVESAEDVVPALTAPEHDGADISLDHPERTESSIESTASKSGTLTEKTTLEPVAEDVVPVPILRARTDVPLTLEDEETPPRNLMLLVAGSSTVLVVLAILATLMLRHGSQPAPTPPPTRPVVVNHPVSTPAATPRIVSVEPSATPMVVSTPMETATPMPVVVNTPPPTPEPTPAVAVTNSTPPTPVEATVSTPPVEPRSQRGHDAVVARDREAEQRAADKRDADRRDAERRDTEQRAADKRDAEQRAVADRHDAEKKETREPVVRKESKPDPTPKPRPVVAKATPAPKKEAAKPAATPDPNRGAPGIGFMR